MKKTILILLVHLLCLNGIYSQRVTVSENISVGGLESYEILGSINNTILFYTQYKGKNYFDKYNQNLEHLSRTPVRFDGEKVSVINVFPMDSMSRIYYAYRNKEGFSLMASNYDEQGRKLKTDTFYHQNTNIKFKKPSIAHSRNHHYTLLYTSSKKKAIKMHFFDNRSSELLFAKSIPSEDYSIDDHLIDIVISDSGGIYFFFYREGRKKENHIHVLHIEDGKLYDQYKYDLDTKSIYDVRIKYNHDRESFFLTGMYKDDSDKSMGYFCNSTPLSQMSNTKTISTTAFDKEYTESIYGKRLASTKKMEHYLIRNIIPRQDGGALLLLEQHREYYRKNAFNDISAYEKSAIATNWLDNYDEDILVIALHPDLKEHWKKVLFKKQFSQDHFKYFSSFYTFLTKSRLRIIFNDEIKKSNTVSEYVLDPLGNFERNSLLNTEYQDLKLRFTEGVQLSPDSFIIPSEHPTKIKLVKIDYSYRI